MRGKATNRKIVELNRKNTSKVTCVTRRKET